MTTIEPHRTWFDDNDWNKLVLLDDLGEPMDSDDFFGKGIRKPPFDQVFNRVTDELSAYMQGTLAENASKNARRCEPLPNSSPPAFLLQNARHFLVDQERKISHPADRPGRLANGTNFATSPPNENTSVYTAWNDASALCIEVTHDHTIDGNPHPQADRKAYLVTQSPEGVIETVLLITGRHVPDTASEYHHPWTESTGAYYSIYEGGAITPEEIDALLTELLGPYGGSQDLDMIPA